MNMLSEDPGYVKSFNCHTNANVYTLIRHVQYALFKKKNTKLNHMDAASFLSEPFQGL